MTVIPAGFAQVNWRFAGANLPLGAECTMGLNVSGYSGTPTDAASDCFTIWADTLLKQQSTSVQLVEATVKFGPSATGPTGVWPGAVNGSIGGTVSPPNTTFLMRKTTAFGGRAGRGRLYLPGVAENDVGNEGAVLPARLTALNVAGEDLLGQLEVGNLQAVLLHGVGSPITAPTPLTGLVGDSRVATQRRRLRR